MYAIDHMPSVIEIGHVGENAVKPIEIDMTAWLKTMPDGVSSILCIRPGETDDDAYIAVTVMNDNVLKWTPLASDIGSVEGYGEIQIRMGAGTLVGRSVRVKTMVRSSIGSSGTLPAAQQPWIDQMIMLKDQTVNAAESAQEDAGAAEVAKQAAENARDAAQAVAGEFQGLTAGATTLDADEDASVEVSHSEGGLYNLQFGIPKGTTFTPTVNSAGDLSWSNDGDKANPQTVNIKGPQGDPAPAAQVQPAVNAYLAQVITNPDSPPLDRSLTQSNAAAPADMVGDLKSAITLSNLNSPDLWELGNIGLSTGIFTTSTSRMRTPGILSDIIVEISVVDGNLILYAWNGDTYIGHWNGTGFDQTSTVVPFSSVSINDLRADYPSYTYRLVWYKSNSYTPVPATDYTNIVMSSTISEISNRIDTVETEIDQINADNDRITNENFVGNLSNAASWESGQIGTSTGNNGTSASRMRTKGYISDYTYQISTVSGYFILFAYDPTAETPYQGVWTGEGFEKVSSGYSSLTSFVLANVKTIYPNYKYRLVWYLSSSYAPDPTTDYTNIMIANEKTAIAYGVTLNGAKIVNMGDSIFGLHFAPVDISTFISQATGATCYNCAFPGTRAVTRSENIGKKKFDLTTLVDAIISGDYSAQDAVREAATGSTDYDHLPTLESVDFSTIDIITLSYGTNDYGGDVVIGAVGNGNASTFIGALQEAIGKLETAFPQARIFVCTPIYRSWHNESTYENADTRQNANGDTLLDFVEAVGMISKAEYVPEIDNHYIGINAATRTIYTTDGTHPNESGRRLIARHMAKELF